MRRDAVAARYAGVLYDLASEHGLVDEILAELDRLSVVADQTPQLLAALSGALLTNAEKKRLMVHSLPGAPQLLLDFYGLVIDKHRAAHALNMTGAFRALVERKRNILDVAVRSAIALTDSEQAALRERLGAMTGATVRLSVRIDPGILGGLIVQAGDKRIDISLRSKLEGLKRQMVGYSLMRRGELRGTA